MYRPSCLKSPTQIKSSSYFKSLRCMSLTNTAGGNRGYLLNVGVRYKFISRVIVKSNIFTSGVAWSENMIFYDHQILHQIFNIFYFFQAKTAKNVIARATITPLRHYIVVVCSQLYKRYVVFIEMCRVQSNVSVIETLA